MWKIPSRPGAYRKLGKLPSCWQQNQVSGKRFSKDVKLFQESAAKPPSPLPPIQTPPKKSGSGLKLLGGSIILVGGALAGTVAYAKANPEFRQQVENNWPILVPVSQYIFNDETKKEPAFGEPLVKRGAIDTAAPLSMGKKATSIKQDETTKSALKEAAEVKKDSADQKKVEERKIKEAAQMKRQTEELRRAEEEVKAKETERRMIEQEIDDAAEIAAHEANVESFVETAARTSKVALDSQQKAIEQTKKHTEKLRIVFDESKDESTNKDKQWDEVIGAAEAKQDAIKTYAAHFIEAKEDLEKLRSAIDESQKTKPKLGLSPTLLEARERCVKMAANLEASEVALVKAQSEAKMLKECQEVLEKNREQFKKELESIVPDVKLGKKGRKLSEEELNTFIAYFIRRIDRLHEQLAEQQALEQKRLEAALEKQTLEDEEMNKTQVLKEVERQEREWALLQEKKVAELHKEYEQEMIVQLRRQAAAHSDHLADVLRVQEKQYQSSLEQQEQAVRQQEWDLYQKQLSRAMTKLRGVEAAIEGRADLEHKNRKSQELWLACETLKQTIKTGKLEGRTWEEKMKPLATEVIAVKEVAGENNFVGQVVDTIPEEAFLRGVYNEDALRERWEKVQRLCKRVALVEETGGSLFRYCVSFFQSLLFVSSSSAPLESEELDVDVLSTFTLLGYASFHLERGELEQAIRYANQLKGLSGLVAFDWVREARLLLEASQAANVLSAHASASGLGGLHIQ